MFNVNSFHCVGTELYGFLILAFERLSSEAPIFEKITSFLMESLINSNVTIQSFCFKFGNQKIILKPRKKLIPTTPDFFSELFFFTEFITIWKSMKWIEVVFLWDFILNVNCQVKVWTVIWLNFLLLHIWQMAVKLSPKKDKIKYQLIQKSLTNLLCIIHNILF